ncbi:MAG: hypothetical protein NTU58_03960 [Candidatus Nealsonbacteria bacterium]|nr:hypothetical protein [Candidatus Nealsonbacteria bacterium]
MEETKDMEEIKGFKKLDERISFRCNQDGKSAKIIIRQIEIPRLKLTCDYYDLRHNGKKANLEEVLEKIPSCCKPLPTEKGNYVCSCEKHLLRIDGNNNNPLVQIAEIPKQIRINLYKHLCK